MPRSIVLSSYLAFSKALPRFFERVLRRRLASGKEDAERIDERRGLASRARPAGQLIWFHAASVGESVSLLELIRRLSVDLPEAHFLVTTGTVTSARLMESRLPDRAFHQFVPLDAVAWVSRFLDHWRPDIAIWTESELWPALLVETDRRGIAMLLLNARMSKKSADRWRFMMSGAVRDLLRLFRAAHVQDGISAGHLRRLGLPEDRMEITGTLKEGAAALPHDEADRAELAAQIKGRPVWLAASTHEGEEEIALTAHEKVLRSNPRLLLILAPRHPRRSADLMQLLEEKEWNTARRSAGEKIDSDTQVYLADTLGEMGLWYRLAPVSFVGGSLVTIGGHNPFEPAALGSAILHGPYVSNFVDIYQRLSEASAARLVSSADALAVAVDQLLNPDRAAAMANAAWEVSSAGADVTEQAVDLILTHIETGSQPGRV
ncbi:MAG: 3-deoxy-D-manno-octulosonic acid transferase [Pseudomonadota bacterium]